MNSAKALEINNLSKTYRDGTVALRGIDLVVEEGEFFGLLGPNGAGKSTTIGIITSLVNKTGGTIRCFGVDLDRDPARRNARLGWFRRNSISTSLSRPSKSSCSKPVTTASRGPLPGNGPKSISAKWGCGTSEQPAPECYPAE